MMKRTVIAMPIETIIIDVSPMPRRRIGRHTASSSAPENAVAHATPMTIAARSWMKPPQPPVAVDKVNQPEATAVITAPIVTVSPWAKLESPVVA